MRFDLARRFDHVQIEDEASFGEPQDQAYLHAIRALATIWEREVRALQRLGAHAIWREHLGEGLPPCSAVKPDRAVRSTTELPTPQGD